MYYKYYECIEIWTDEINKGFSEQFGKSIVFYDVLMYANWKKIPFKLTEKQFFFSRWETIQTFKRASTSSVCFRRFECITSWGLREDRLMRLIRTRFRRPHLFPNANDCGYATFSFAQCYDKRKSLSPHEHTGHTVARNSLVISPCEQQTGARSFGKEGTLPWHKWSCTNNLHLVKPLLCYICHREGFASRLENESWRREGIHWKAIYLELTTEMCFQHC